MKFRNLRGFIIRKKYTLKTYNMSINNLPDGIQIYRFPDVIYFIYYHKGKALISILCDFTNNVEMFISTRYSKQVRWCYIKHANHYDRGQLEIFKDDNVIAIKSIPLYNNATFNATLNYCIRRCY